MSDDGYRNPITQQAKPFLRPALTAALEPDFPVPMDDLRRASAEAQVDGLRVRFDAVLDEMRTTRGGRLVAWLIRRRVR